ncbi:hypothetical protein Ae201684P_006144 [Aphanomyces euteiches]|nr:hypothetical protein Ae201684P_006144 [Aphanomyces euteiches]
MGYGQTWLFRYPAPQNEALAGGEREFSRQSSYYDLEDSSEEEPAANRNRDRDVAAFTMTPISSDRILVTTPWSVCELLYLHNDKQFHLDPVGMSPSKEKYSDLDHAMASAGMPHESSVLACDVLTISPSKSVLVLLYQEPRGRCCLTLQSIPDSSSKTDLSHERSRFEQSSVPLKSVVVNVRDVIGALSFFGVLLFRTDSIIACGYVTDDSTVKTELNFPLSMVSYHTLTHEGTRLLALGCANGVVRLFSGKAAYDGFATVTETKQFELDGPISSLHLFNVHASQGSLLCDVLVSSSIGYAVVYHHPFNPACTAHVLPDSDYFDSILCCLSADIDMDGSAELLLGTFSNALIAYKHNRATPNAPWSVLTKDRWDFFFFGPVYSIVCQDMNGDGVDEIIIASTDGIHVLEPDCDQVREKLQAVLTLLQPSETSS